MNRKIYDVLKVLLITVCVSWLFTQPSPEPLVAFLSSLIALKI
ncbi:MAG: hypothetical protein AAFV93_17350 [Chloroflexota bacterium]